jgi:hypothetical protein
MQQVEGYIAEIRSEARECLGCGNLVVGGSSWCMNCVREMIAERGFKNEEAPRRFAGITLSGWAVIFGLNLICAAAAVAIALLA